MQTSVCDVIRYIVGGPVGIVDGSLVDNLLQFLDLRGPMAFHDRLLVDFVRRWVRVWHKVDTWQLLTGLGLPVVLCQVVGPLSDTGIGSLVVATFHVSLAPGLLGPQLEGGQAHEGADKQHRYKEAFALP